MSRTKEYNRNNTENVNPRSMFSMFPAFLIRLSIIITVILTGLFGMGRNGEMLFGENVFAADIASGTISHQYGPVPWRITEDGTLIIGDGNDYTLPLADYWYSYHDQIKSIRAEGHVKLMDSQKNAIFSGWTNLISVDGTGFDTSEITVLNRWFSGCTNLKSINLSTWDVKNVEDMQSMFENCSSLEKIDLSSWNTSSLKYLTKMFCGCSKAEQINVSNWTVKNVFGMDYMFQDCTSLKTIDLSSWKNTDNTTTMICMFNGCTNLKYVNFSNATNTKLKYMNSMFANCESLEAINLSGFRANSLENMTGLFQNCHSLKAVDLSSFGINNKSDLQMYEAFRNCSSLEKLDLSGWNTSEIIRMDMGLQYGATNLKELIIDEGFSFKGATDTSDYWLKVCNPPENEYYTGKWIRDDGLFGPYTRDELIQNYNETMAGTWVWQLNQTALLIKYQPSEDVSGSMSDQWGNINTDTTLSANQFKRYGYHFDHWEGSDGNTYTDGQTIPANTFTAGTTLKLRPVLVPDDNSITFENGVADVYLKRGEKITIPGLPGGTSYSIYEETPDGWQLIEQNNAAGTIPANGSADAEFVNEYVPGTTTAQFSGIKRLDGRAAAANAFSFELYEGETLLHTVSTQEGGFIQFPVITYEQSDVGTHTYTIKEVDGGDASYDYDTHEETVTVEVTDDGHGNLSSTTSYDADGIIFNNKTRPGILKITKETSGASEKNADDTFTFKVTITNENGQPIDDNVYWYIEGQAEDHPDNPVLNAMGKAKKAIGDLINNTDDNSGDAADSTVDTDNEG